MSEIFDWQRVADPGGVVHYAVESLRQGRTVAFPSANGYAAMASALVPEAVARLALHAGGEALTAALRSVEEARAWAPSLGPLALRMVRRLWPGSVILSVGGDIENGLAGRLPEEVRARLCASGRLLLAMPQHEAAWEVLRHFPDPVLMTQPSGEPVADVIVADDLRMREPATVVAVDDDRWEIVRPGAVTAEQICRHTARWIVFICTGNTCRSPLAEALCKKQLSARLGCTIEELPARGYYVVSAGLAALPGCAAAFEAEQVARGYGVDLSTHRSQPLTGDLAANADYLVGMTENHVHALAEYFGEEIVAPRLLDPSGDIADPIGGEQAVYDECAATIWQCLESFLAEIMPLEASQS
jgi:protein-tyrosine-phosphatase/tRNA A37 threonylcarbamoyladenosine synthetase subunit TsaC/SUA5/YrdC